VRSASDINQYLRSLESPFDNPGAKIPDLIHFPSGTFQLQYETTMTPGTGGDLCGVYVVPMIGGATGVSFNPINTGINASVGGNITWTGQNWPNRTTIQSLYDSIRCVSAELLVEFMGNSTQDAGLIVAGFQPSANIAAANLTNITGALSESYTKTVPVRNGPIKVLWKPTDNKDWEYRAAIEANTSAIFPGTIFVLASGVTPVTSVFHVRVVANFEGLPHSDTVNLINTSGSPGSFSAIQDAWNWIAGSGLNNIRTAYTAIEPSIRPFTDTFLQGVGSNLGRRLSRVANRQLTF
jgi:hypothetical protein